MLNRDDYCLSCEHILTEKGNLFFPQKIVQGRPTNYKVLYCKNCGQKIVPEIEQISNDYNTFLTALSNPKIKVVAFVAPSVRAGISEYFGILEDSQQKIVTALKQLGVHEVFSMNFGADLTIYEESKELLQRLKTNTNLPMFTSCCPAWVNYVCKVYPHLKRFLSTCKSPQQMMGATINNYYPKANNIEPTDIFIVSVVPCLAKKIERIRENIDSGIGKDVDACITTTELAKLIEEKHIDFLNLRDTEFDKLFKDYSGAAANFGATSGVSRAVMLNAFPDAKFTCIEKENFVEYVYDVDGKKYYVACVQGLSNTNKILQEISAGKSKYTLVEVMACKGGCIGGAGQPSASNLDWRKQTLENANLGSKIKNANNNLQIQNLYKTYLQDNHKILHENR